MKTLEWIKASLFFWLIPLSVAFYSADKDYISFVNKHRLIFAVIIVLINFVILWISTNQDEQIHKIEKKIEKILLNNFDKKENDK